MFREAASHSVDALHGTRDGERGVATSLELFDAEGNTIVMFFGVQKPGYDGGAAWKGLTDELT